MANIFETARAEHAYNRYVKGLESVAGLVETLSGPGPFTIFIPTDAAFDRLSQDQQATLAEDPETLARVLKYHIVPGYYSADDLLDRLFLKTLEGQRLRVWSDVSEVPVGEEEIDTRSDAWTRNSGEPEGRQRDHARHRQSAHPIIHHALTTRSTPFSGIYPCMDKPYLVSGSCFAEGSFTDPSCDESASAPLSPGFSPFPRNSR